MLNRITSPSNPTSTTTVENGYTATLTEGYQVAQKGYKVATPVAAIVPAPVVPTGGTSAVRPAAAAASSPASSTGGTNTAKNSVSSA